MDMPFLRKHVSDALQRVPDSPGQFVLAAHQKEAALAISGHVGSAKNRPIAITVIPTAGGKTEIFARAVGELCGGTADGTVVSPRILLIVPTLDLLDQTLLRVSVAAPGLDIGIINGNEKRVCLTTATTYASFMQMAASGLIRPGDIDCLILDEAHRALSELRQDILTPFLERMVTLAFTASPKFDSEKNIHNFLGAENEVFRATDERLRSDKVIAPVVNYILKVDIKGDVPDDREDFQRILDAASARIFSEFLAEHHDTQIDQRLSDRQIFGFARSISHSIHTADYLNAHFEDGTPPATSVSSKDSREDIQDALRRFRDGRVSVLMNKWLLSEGIDVPTASGVVNLAPTTSLVVQLQRGGRCRRRNRALAEDDPAQIGMVIDFSFHLNGKPMHPGQVFYCQAIEDLSAARIVTMEPVSVESIADDAVSFLEDVSDEVYADEILAFDPVNEVGAGAAPTDAETVEHPAGVESEASSPTVEAEPNAVERHMGEDGDDDCERGVVMEGGAEDVEPLRFVRTAMTISHDIGDIVYLLDHVARERIAHFPSKTDEWLSFTNCIGPLRTSYASEAFQALWRDIEASVLSGKQPMVGDRPIRAGRFRVVSAAPVCVHRDMLPILAGAMGSRINLEAKPTDWLGATEVAGLLGITGRRLEPVWQDFKRAVDEGGVPTLAGAEFRAGWFRSKHLPTFCLHRNDVPRLGSALGLHVYDGPQDKENWLSRNEAAKVVHCGWKSSSFSSAWSDIFEGNVGNVTFRTANVAKAVSGVLSPCLHRDDIPLLMDLMGRPQFERSVPLKDESWLSRFDASTMVKLAPRNPKITALWRRLDEVVPQDGSSEHISGIRFALRRRGIGDTSLTTCIHRDDLAIFSQLVDGVFGEVGDKTEDWLSVTAFLQMGLTCTETDFRQAWCEMEVLRTSGASIEDKGRPIRFELRRNFNKTVPCIHRDDLPLFVRRFKLDIEGGPKDDSWLNMTDVVRTLSPRASDLIALKAVFADLKARVGKAVVLAGHRVSAQWRVVSNGRNVCIRRDDLPAIAEHLGLSHKLRGAPPKTDEWFTRNECINALRLTKHRPEFTSFWEGFVEQIKVDGVADCSEGALKMEYRRSGQFMSVMLHADDLQRVHDAWRKHVESSDDIDLDETVSSFTP